jgi:hypothetical protein
MSLWWRAENSSIDHPKLLKLSDALHRAWYTLMCVASANDGPLPPADDIAVRLRMPVAKVAEWITKLVAAELFDNVDGVFVPHNWTKRQYKSDKVDPTAAERMKRHRRNKRNGTTTVTDVTVRNDRNALRPEAEAKAEPESEQSRADAGAPIDEEFGRKVLALQTSVSLAFSTRGMPIPALDRCPLWLTMGYGQGAVLGSIDRVLKRGKAIATLEYFDAAIREDHAKAGSPVGPQIVSIQEFIIEGTLEWSCWERYLRETTGRGSPVTDNRDENGRVRRGWFRPTRVPPGYDEATGEKLAPNQSEDAA